MATFITSLILWGFIAAVLGFVGKLIYDVQQQKKKPKEVETDWNELKDKFQKLAGITEDDVQKGTDHLTEKIDEVRQKLKESNLNGDKLVEELKKEFQNSEFPAPDESINVRTEKITTIDLNSYEDKDPLASVPMSRVSKEAKKKMAEIAKQDINTQLEQNAEKFAALFPNAIESNTELPNEIKEAMINAPIIKPKRKSNPKQMNGVQSTEPFVKTRKKATKKTKTND